MSRKNIELKKWDPIVGLFIEASTIMYLLGIVEALVKEQLKNVNNSSKS